jgi:biotin-dependent carboxylase-like uncharacterized protein
VRDDIALEVLAPGLLTTVQDSGRPRLGHLGVPRGGECDPWSLAVANLLVGNPPDAAALELTLVGPELRAARPLLLGVAGADLGGVVVTSGRRLRPGGTYELSGGAVVAFPGRAEGRGARAYLALRGGIDVPLVLGSASVCLAGRFGGLDGRPLRSGDTIAVGRPRTGTVAPGESRWPQGLSPDALDPRAIRILPGPHASLMAPAFEDLTNATWLVGPASDRMGLRLDGATCRRAGDGTVLSHGVTWGAIQLPPDGRAIVLLADHRLSSRSRHDLGGSPAPRPAAAGVGGAVRTDNGGRCSGGSPGAAGGPGRRRGRYGRRGPLGRPLGLGGWLRAQPSSAERSRGS